MIVADLFDFTVHDLHHFRADRLDSSTLGSRPREERLRDSVAAVAGAEAQIAMPVRKHRELSLVRTPHFCATGGSLACRANKDRLFIKQAITPSMSWRVNASK